MKDDLWYTFLYRRCKVIFIPCRGGGGKRGGLGSSYSYLQRRTKKFSSHRCKPKQTHTKQHVGWDPPPVYCYDCCGCSPCAKSSCSLLHNTPLPPAPTSRNPIAGTASSAGVSREIWFLKDGHRLLREQHCRTFFITTASWCHILVTVP